MGIQLRTLLLWPFQLRTKCPSCLFCCIKIQHSYILYAAGKQIPFFFLSCAFFAVEQMCFTINHHFPASTVLSSNDRLVPVSMRSCRSQLACQLPVWRSGPVVNTLGLAGTAITHRGHIQCLQWILHIKSIAPLLSDVSPLQETEQGRAGCVCSMQVIPPKVISLSSLLHNQT